MGLLLAASLRRSFACIGGLIWRLCDFHDCEQPAREPRRRKHEVTDAGKGWFNMERSSQDADFRRDIKVIQLRNYLDPKKFYKVRAVCSSDL